MLLGDLESLPLMEPLIEPRKLLLSVMLAATGLKRWREADERRLKRLLRELFVDGWMSRSDICEEGEFQKLFRGGLLEIRDADGGDSSE